MSNIQLLPRLSHITNTPYINCFRYIIHGCFFNTKAAIYTMSKFVHILVNIGKLIRIISLKQWISLVFIEYFTVCSGWYSCIGMSPTSQYCMSEAEFNSCTLIGWQVVLMLGWFMSYTTYVSVAWQVKDELHVSPLTVGTLNYTRKAETVFKENPDIFILSAEGDIMLYWRSIAVGIFMNQNDHEYGNSIRCLSLFIVSAMLPEAEIWKQ